jgi:hypothetical protein
LFMEVRGLPIHALSQSFRPFPPSSLIPELRRTGRAGRRVDVFLGLKPQAESFLPLRGRNRMLQKAPLSSRLWAKDLGCSVGPFHGQEVYPSS